MRLARAFLAILAVLSMPVVAAPPAKPPIPDFTRGDAAGAGHDWNLGPTGGRGWVYGWKGQTGESRQILITAVAEGSPAAGRLAVGDVILGVGGDLQNTFSNIFMSMR